MKCGGTLIGRRTVLTAAHCQPSGKKQKTFVTIGEWNTSTSPDCQILENKTQACNPKEKNVPVQKWIIHPDFNRNTIENDIAMLRLKERMLFNFHNGVISGKKTLALAEPLCLPFFAGMKELSKDTHLEVVGWGEMILFM